MRPPTPGLPTSPPGLLTPPSPVDSPWQQYRQPKATNWKRIRPDTPRVRRFDPPLSPEAPSQPTLQPTDTTIDNAWETVSESLEDNSSDSEAEKDLQRLTGVPLARRRLGDSPGWRGASAHTKWNQREGVTTRSMARQEVQEEAEDVVQEEPLTSEGHSAGNG